MEAKPHQIEMEQPTEYDSEITPNTQPRRDITAMWKFDTSDLMMMKTWLTNIFDQLNLNGSVEHKQPHNMAKNMICLTLI